MRTGGFARLRCSRALLLLCVVYLVALLLFHQALLSTSTTSTDDGKVPVVARDYDQADDSAKGSVNSTIRWLQSAANVHKRLQSLEEGMLNLEKQVMDMKISLAEQALSQKRARLTADVGATRLTDVQGKASSQPQAEWSVADEETLDYSNSTLVKVTAGLALFSAYHDDRQEEVWVRMMVIVRGDPDSQRMLCHFDYKGDNSATYIIEAKQYEMCENHRKRYLGFIYSCPVPLGRQLDYSLSVSHFSSKDRRVPVTVKPVAPPGTSGQQIDIDRLRYNFSVCVSPLFGVVSPKRLVEFLELTRLLGVQQVFFYDLSTSEVVQRVLKHYLDRGWISITPWRIPKAMSNDIWYNGQLVVNNDCLYRTMAQSVYTAFHDIDEFIVPRASDARTLADILPPVLPKDTCGYSFASAFFDPGVATQYPDDLMTVALTAKTEAISKVRTKVMVMPQRVFEVGIHHVSKQLLEDWQPRPFSPETALLHHYRQCLPDYGMRCNSWVKDTIIGDRYMQELKTRVGSAIQTLKL